ncbi:MAG TPA: hypothetical protein VKA95_06420 [Nitrososphaeraceae archaeon]|nr:hypothetical protein [Nitrososphaeraceae archaeon]
MIDLKDDSQCKYGITKLAEEQNQLDFECETPAVRRIGFLDTRVPSGLAAIELCELHYQACLEWEKRQK